MSDRQQQAQINFAYHYARRNTNAEAQVDRYIAQRTEQLQSVDAHTTHPLLEEE